MSYLDANKENINWAVTPGAVSVHRAPGCVQCGSRLEMTANGKYSLSGKCLSCMNRGPDDEVFSCSYDDMAED